MQTMTSAPSWMTDVRTGLLGCILTSVPVLCGITFASNFLPETLILSARPSGDYVKACFHFDAFNYAAIAENGYFYDPTRGSKVAFFPAYPLTAQFVVWLTGWDSRLTLLALANLMFLATFILFTSYLPRRFPNDPPKIGFSFWPCSALHRRAFSFECPIRKAHSCFSHCWQWLALSGAGLFSFLLY